LSAEDSLEIKIPAKNKLAAVTKKKHLKNFIIIVSSTACLLV